MGAKWPFLSHIINYLLYKVWPLISSKNTINIYFWHTFSYCCPDKLALHMKYLCIAFCYTFTVNVNFTQNWQCSFFVNLKNITIKIDYNWLWCLQCKSNDYIGAFVCELFHIYGNIYQDPNKVFPFDEMSAWDLYHCHPWV